MAVESAIIFGSGTATATLSAAIAGADAGIDSGCSFTDCADTVSWCWLSVQASIKNIQAAGNNIFMCVGIEK